MIKQAVRSLQKHLPEYTSCKVSQEETTGTHLPLNLSRYSQLNNHVKEDVYETGMQEYGYYKSATES